MLYRCLSDFLEELSQAGELSRVEEETDPSLALAEAVARSAAAGGPALLFAAVKGHDLPVAANLLATERRICRALGVESLEALSQRIVRLMDASLPEGWIERIKSVARPAAMGGFLPRNVRSGACQQIVRLGGDVDLGILPLVQMNTLARRASEGNFTQTQQPDPSLALRAGVADIPSMTAPAIYSAAVLSAEPDSHRPVWGRFDLQRIDRARLAVCWADYDEHARLLDEYRLRGRKMPVAAIIGGDPAFQLAASAPLPADADVCALAGLLREKPIDAVAGRSVDLELPAEAEIIIEGIVDPAEPPAAVGPTCAPLGHCTRPRQARVMQATAMTQRANPIFAAFIPGRPPHEHCAMLRAMQRAFLPLVRLSMPELIDFDMPEFAAGRHWAVVSIRKTYPGQGRRAAHAAWGLRPMQFAKTLIVVDAEVDVRDREGVLAAIAMNFRPELDMVIERGPADPYDPALPSGALSERMALDATRKLS